MRVGSSERGFGLSLQPDADRMVYLTPFYAAFRLSRMTKPLKIKTKRLVPRLIVQSGPEIGHEFLVLKDVTLIGRSEQCDIVIANPLVSRRHSQITWDGTYCTLEDLGSTNGTFVNEQRLTAAHVLRVGDRVRVADVVLTFNDPQATLTGLKWPALLLDPPNRVYVNRKPVELSQKEFALLGFLYDHAERICTKAEIATAVWPDYHGEVFDYQVESLIRRLRQKIEVDPEEPKLIVTLRGRGYRLVKS
jgi:pSer/pThr/pTyr-binding forkhead associated (FHA) protein